MKIKIGDLTKHQISKICQQTTCCTIAADGYVCPPYNVTDCRCMVGSPDVDDYNDMEVNIKDED